MHAYILYAKLSSIHVDTNIVIVLRWYDYINCDNDIKSLSLSISVKSSKVLTCLKWQHPNISVAAIVINVNQTAKQKIAHCSWMNIIFFIKKCLISYSENYAVFYF